MKKRFLLLIMLVLLLLTSLIVFAGCKHKHDFSLKIATDAYFSAPATCGAKATYFYSCECGERGTETFEYGKFTNHNFANNQACSVCNATYGLEYELNELGQSYSVVDIGTATETKIIIPNSYNEKPVKGIGNDAFRGSRELTGVIIPDSVTSVGEDAFRYCYALSSVVIGDCVTTIGDYAFQDCYSLTSVTIPDSVKSIGDNAFEGCSRLIEVCNKSKLRIVAGGEEHGKVAYYAQNVYKPSSGTSKLSTDKDGYVLYADGNDVTLMYYVGSETELSLPNGITQIHDYAFRNTFYNKNITKISIPGSITVIENGPFSACENLTTVTIANGVRVIGNSAFYDCKRLTNITIPDSVTSIGNHAFAGCYALTSMTIPDGITSIDAFAFSRCESLTSIIIPKGVTSIGEFAFAECYGLTNVTIPDGVTSIGEKAFFSCLKLTSITIPNSVTSIGEDAFSGCRGLIIYCEAQSQPSGWSSNWQNCFVVWDCNNNDVADDGYIYTIVDGIRYGIKDGVATVVKQVNNITSANILAKITYKNTDYSVTSISNSAFDGYVGLTSVTIPDGITSIGEYAFAWCYGLRSVTIPNSVTNIENRAFSYCYGLRSVTIGNGVIRIEDYVFADCWNLTSITIGNGVTSIGRGAFSANYDIKTVYYLGAVADWSNISIEHGNDWLTNAATIYYYSQTEPTESGNYWHYDTDGKTPIIWKKEN